MEPNLRNLPIDVSFLHFIAFRDPPGYLILKSQNAELLLFSGFVAFPEAPKASFWFEYHWNSRLLKQEASAQNFSPGGRSQSLREPYCTNPCRSSSERLKNAVFQSFPNWESVRVVPAVTTPIKVFRTVSNSCLQWIAQQTTPNTYICAGTKKYRTDSCVASCGGGL